MNDILKQLQDDLNALSIWIKNNPQIPLKEKLQAKDEVQAIQSKLSKVFLVNPLEPYKELHQYLSLGQVNEIASSSLSVFNRLQALLSSLIYDKDKIITLIKTEDPLIGSRVYNETLDVYGVIRLIYCTKKATYCLVESSGIYYHSYIDQWME